MPDEFADPFFIEVIVSRRAIHQRGLRNRFSSGPILFSFFLMLSGFANAQQSSEQKSAAIEPVVERVVDYTDSIGVEWRRWTIVDDIDGKKLLMVLEAPVDSLDDHSTSQVVLEQKSFSLNNLQELDERMRYFYELKDLSSRDSQFDKDRKELGVMNFKPLWIPRKNSWTMDDEREFAKWYSANITEDYFVGEGIDFDCADFALLVRWTYAHDHGLPMVNTLSGSGKLFGHFSGRRDWDRLRTNSSWRRNERFKAGLKYLNSSTYTKSIIRDLYPVQIGRDFVTPGTVHLNISPGNHHTQVIDKVGLHDYCGTSECISVLYGNLPAREVSYATVPTFGPLKKGEGGFLRWRWPELVQGTWRLVKASKMPGYSEEQFAEFDPVDSAFQAYIEDKMKLVIQPQDRAITLMYSVKRMIYDRISISTMGYLHCHLQYCDPRSTLYDDLSTPSKDRRLREKRDEFLTLISQFAADDPFLIQLIKETKHAIMASHPILFHDYLFNVNGISDSISSDPSHSFNQRWGIKDSPDDFVHLSTIIFYYAFWERDVLVRRALNACQPHQSPLRCDPNSSEIQELSTERVDKGLRIFKRSFDSQIKSALAATVKNASEEANNYTAVDECPQGPNGRCTISNYLYDNSPSIDHMSSDPTDPKRRRYGFQ